MMRSEPAQGIEHRPTLPELLAQTRFPLLITLRFPDYAAFAGLAP
jgi:hypothetical protein